MMFGAFIALWLTNPEYVGLSFWIAAPLAMGLFGSFLDVTIIRRMFGQSQTAVVTLTIALGFVIRFVAGLFGIKAFAAAVIGGFGSFSLSR